MENKRVIHRQGQDIAGEDHTQDHFPSNTAQNLLTCKQMIRFHTEAKVHVSFMSANQEMILLCKEL